MRNKLLAQEKVNILIPVDPTERAGVVEWRKDKNGEDYQVHISGAITSVQLNGYKYFIPKGVYTPVPRQVAEVISKAQQQTLEAGSNISLDRIDPKQADHSKRYCIDTLIIIIQWCITEN